MTVSKDDVLDHISGLSVLELSELVKEFEEKFGVKSEPNLSGNAKEYVPEYVKMNDKFNKNKGKK